MNINKGLTAILCAGALAPVSWAGNYLQNPGFEFPTNNGYGGNFSGTGFGETVSQDWNYVNYTDGTASTTEATPPGGLAGSGQYSLYITESTVDNAIYQPIESGGFDVLVGSVSGWVYLQSGSVGLALDGVGTDEQVYASTSTVGQWVYLAANTPGAGSYNFFIVALSANTSFYADNMDADSAPLSPEPASFTALGLGALALLRRRNRKK